MAASPENWVGSWILEPFIVGAPTVLNMSRCPSKIFAYAQARRPVIATRVGELPEVLGEFPNYIEYSPRAYADAIAAAMAAPRGADVEYHVERHTYADRAQRLLDVLNGPGPRRAA